MYLLIDMAEPKGHIRLNQFYIDSIGSSKCKVLCSDKLKDHYKQYDYLSFFSYNKSNKFFRLIKMLSILYLIVFKIKIKNIKKILFLSYDSIFIIPILYILKIFKISILSIEHNTVPISKRKKFLQKIIGNNIDRLVYTNYIKNIYDNLGIISQVVEHPIRNFLNEQNINSNQISLINQISNNRKIVFCPSASVNLYKYRDKINQKSK